MRQRQIRKVLGVLGMGAMFAIPPAQAAGPFSSGTPREPSVAAPRAPAQTGGNSNQEIVDLLVGSMRRAGMSMDGMRVSANNGQVTLSGSVATEYQRERAERVARSVKGVTRVDNRLETREIATRTPPPSGRPIASQQPRSAGTSSRDSLKVAAPRTPPPQQRMAAAESSPTSSQLPPEFSTGATRAESPLDVAGRIDRGIAAPRRNFEAPPEESYETTIPPQIPRAPPVQTADETYAETPTRAAPPARLAAPAQAGQYSQAYQMERPPAAPQRPVAAMPPAAYAPAMNPAAAPYGMVIADPTEVPQVPRKNGARMMRSSHAMASTPLSSAGMNHIPHDQNLIVPTGGQTSASAWPYVGSFHPFPQIPLGWKKSQLEWDDGYWQMNFRPRTDRWWWYLDHRNWSGNAKTID